MCLICTEWQKGNLTTEEAFRNLGEALNVANDEDDYDTVEHLLDLSNKMIDQEVPPVSFSDADLDKSFWEATHKSDEE